MAGTPLTNGNFYQAYPYFLYFSSYRIQKKAKFQFPFRKAKQTRPMARLFYAYPCLFRAVIMHMQQLMFFSFEKALYRSCTVVFCWEVLI